MTRVLLSAYACEPNKGSEQEVGWQRALHIIAHADEAWVVTRANNRAAIEAEQASLPRGLNFLYYDLPPWMLKLKRRRGFLPIYMALWQWGAYRVAAHRHRESRFDRVYHVTFCNLLTGSQMWRLGVPLIVGPIGGGERAPGQLRKSMPGWCRMQEKARDLGIIAQRFNPLSWHALKAAERIYVVSPESMRLVQHRWHAKTSIQLGIGHAGDAGGVSTARRPGQPRFVFAGRLLHWKGIHFAIKALAEARAQMPAATLTVFGEGPARDWLIGLAAELGIQDAVCFAGHLPRAQLMGQISSYTALVFPSLHDSGGLVVLEAMTAAVPVICLDLGGPGMMVNASCGVVVPTASSDEANVVTAIAQAMTTMDGMQENEWSRLSAGAVLRARELSWSRLTARVTA